MHNTEYHEWFHDRRGTPYLVRPTESSDAAVLVALIDQVGSEEVYIANERALYTVEQQEQLIAMQSPVQCLLVATIDNRVVGTLEAIQGTFSKNRHTATFGMALDAPFRGRGIGEGLLRMAHRWAIDHGVQKMAISVFATNVGAIRLYQRLGYHEEGRRSDQFRIQGQSVDEVWLARTFEV